jgi:hypothetical protein
MHSQELDADSVPALLDLLRKREERLLKIRQDEEYKWFFRGDNKIITWYRGHADKDWELLPTILRKWFRDRIRDDPPPWEKDFFLLRTELGINNDFRRMGLSMLPDRADLIAIYFLAQHHGIPTRLLDWSTNILAALFFTVISHPEKNGAIYLLDPTWPIGIIGINEWPPDEDIYGGYPRGPFDIRYKLVRRTIQYLFDKDHEDLPKPESVLPLLPDLRAGRMLQQASCFTLHMPGAYPIGQPFLEKIIIPAESKSSILTSLRHMGITWATLFPDLDHLSLEIRSSLNLNP